MSNSPMWNVVRDLLAAASKTEAYTEAEFFRLSIENPPFERLDIEKWPQSQRGRVAGETHRIAVVHYFDDGHLDNGVVMTDTGLPVDYVYHGPCGRVWLDIYSWDGPQLVVRTSVQREIAYILRIWARNLREQGFIEAARRLRTRE